MLFNFVVLDQFRERSGPFGTDTGNTFGRFFVPGPCARLLCVIASDGDDDMPWEHVSVSTRSRCPNWEEMCFIKSLFWDDEETVMELHPPRSQWINQHPYCLHMWKPLGKEIPLPPQIAVGFRG